MNTEEQRGDSAYGLFLKILATLFFLWIVYRIQEILVLGMISLMLSSSLHPVVRRLQARFSRRLAITLLVVSLLVSIVLVVALTLPPVISQGIALTTHLPQYLTQMEQSLGKYGPLFHAATKNLTVQASPAGVEPRAIQEGIAQVTELVTSFVTILMLTTYLLLDGPKIATQLVGFFPRPHRLLLRRMFDEIGEQVGAYLRGQAITSAFAGGFVAIFLSLCRVPEPFALGGLMAIADAIPIAGVLIGTVPAVLMALTVSPSRALIVLAGYVVYYLIESHVIVPRIYGKTMKLSPLVILLSILIGASLMGMAGALFALPVAATIPTLYRYFIQWKEQTAGAKDD